MSDYDEALSRIAEIRSQIAASTSFRGFAPAQFAVVAVLCALIAAGQAWWPPMRAGSAVDFVIVWGVVLAGVTGIVAVESHSRAIRAHGLLADMMLGTTVRRIAPFALSIAAIGFIVCGYAPEAARLVPGLWLMLMGLAGFAAAGSLPRTITPVSVWFLASGLVVLIVAARSGQAEPWMMGVPLAIGHALVAVVYARDRSGDAA